MPKKWRIKSMYDLFNKKVWTTIKIGLFLFRQNRTTQFFKGVIIIFVYVMNSHNSPLMYVDFKIVFDCELWTLLVKIVWR